MYASYDTRKEIIISDGISQKILSYGRALMAVEMIFEDGKEGESCRHIHEKLSHILEGKFEFVIGDKKLMCTKGDTVYVPPNSIHQVSCIDKGKMLDVFTPIREDLLV